MFKLPQFLNFREKDDDIEQASQLLRKDISEETLRDIQSIDEEFYELIVSPKQMSSRTGSVKIDTLQKLSIFRTYSTPSR